MTNITETDLTPILELIVTQINPPIPTKEFDFQCTRKDYDIGDIIGYGPTREAAIENYREMHELHFDEELKFGTYTVE